MNIPSQIHWIIKNTLSKRFVLFIFVGLVNTAFGYGLFAFLIYLQLHYALASFVSTILGILFNFKTTGLIVFKNNNNILIFRFFVAYGITFLFGLLFLYIMNRFSISNYIAGAIWLLPAAILSFLLQKSIVFRT